MRHLKSFVLALSLVSLGVLDAHDASACGGCFVAQTENTQVTGHEMILSISQTKTTLWDQITYDGDPLDFGWMLPIKGNAGFDLNTDFSLSSDALFSTLDQLTQVSVSSPIINCSPPSCGDSFGTGGGVDNGGGGPTPEPPVTVVAEKVVGPYQVVHLKATDPSAMTNWLAMNGYVVPADSSAVVDAYIAEQYDFIAMKLVPAGVRKMRPVRVTLPGSAPTLPLRMVAVGTGAVTSITLYVVGEGRYQPTNFPEFEVNQSDLVWDWDTSSSNYKAIRQAGFDAAKGKAWLVEAAEPASPFSIQFPLEDKVNFEPQNSGYGDAQGVGAKEELFADLEALDGFINQGSMWMMRFHGELPRSALAEDLALGASMKQEPVVRFFQTTKAIGTAPSCPPQPPCPEPPDSGNNDLWDGFFGSSSSTGGGGCAMVSPVGSSTVLSGLALCAALAFARRRRSQAR